MPQSKIINNKKNNLCKLKVLHFNLFYSIFFYLITNLTLWFFYDLITHNSYNKSFSVYIIVFIILLYYFNLIFNTHNLSQKKRKLNQNTTKETNQLFHPTKRNNIPHFIHKTNYNNIMITQPPPTTNHPYSFALYEMCSMYDLLYWFDFLPYHL